MCHCSRARSVSLARSRGTDAVAECAFKAYHDEGGTLHWYVPEEIREPFRSWAEIDGYWGRPGSLNAFRWQFSNLRVKSLAPDLALAFASVLDRFDGDAQDFLQELTDTEFNLVMTLICAAYLMDARVKNALKYPGQQALTPNRGGFGAEELVIEMMQKPKRYRDL